MSLRVTWVFFLALTVVAVGCRRDRAVPYEGSESKVTPEASPVEEPYVPIEGKSLPEGTTELAVEGAPLLTSAGALRTVLAIDLDQDGDRDALFVRTEEEGLRTVLSLSPRDGSAFGTTSDLATLAEGCSIERAGLRTLSRRFAVAELALTCDAAPERGISIIALESTPRVGERIRMREDASSAANPLGLAVETRDVDGDGFEDALVELSIATTEGSEAIRASLPWLDRPGGLARDARQPEETLVELAGRAKEALASDPKTAASLAQSALTLHRALCRESGAPLLRFGDAHGLPCGRSAGAGRASAIRAAALARQGAHLEALEGLAGLESEALTVTAEDRALVERAFGTSNANERWSFRKIGAHPAMPRTPDARRSAIAFLDAETLVLRGEAPKTIRLNGDEGPPVPDDANDAVLRDPSGRFAVLDIVRTCDGVALRIVRSDDLVAGVLAGRPISEPLVEALPPPAGIACPRREPIPGATGFQLLGWAPQGIVVARASEVRVVPVTVQGEPAGAATVLEPSAALPAPLPSGPATPDGSHFAVATAYGILFVARSPGGKTRWIRPPGWEKAPFPIGDLALAPDASRIAVMRHDEIWLIDGLE